MPDNIYVIDNENRNLNDAYNYEFIEYNGVVIPTQYLYTCFNYINSIKSLNRPSDLRLIELIKELYCAEITPTELVIKRLLKAEKEKKATEFINHYKTVGLTKFTMQVPIITEGKLRALFKEEKRFNGRVPKIIPQIAFVCDKYGIPCKEAVNKFNIKQIHMLFELGLSKLEVALLYIHLSEKQLNNVSGDLEVAQMVSILLSKAFHKSNAAFLNAGLWIANHGETNKALIRKVYKNASKLTLTPETSIDNINAQFSKNKAIAEVKKIEKAYKACNFKFKKCVCNLQKSLSRTEKYEARILEGDDPRQVMLGYDTDCCQYLGEAGESSMMHGLLNPQAGFFVITKRDSDKVVAQAEAWELNEDTLVFDNIEFANDAEIDQYKEIIELWVAESPYKNIIMGCGYNAFYDSDLFECAGRVIPPVTPYELYVLSYEDDCYAREEICCLPSEAEAKRLLEAGVITYFDYVYCDSEEESVYLKKNNQLSRYFTEETQREKAEFQEDLDF